MAARQGLDKITLGVAQQSAAPSTLDAGTRHADPGWRRQHPDRLARRDGHRATPTSTPSRPRRGAARRHRQPRPAGGDSPDALPRPATTRPIPSPASETIGGGSQGRHRSPPAARWRPAVVIPAAAPWTTTSLNHSSPANHGHCFRLTTASEAAFLRAIDRAQGTATYKRADPGLTCSSVAAGQQLDDQRLPAWAPARWNVRRRRRARRPPRLFGRRRQRRPGRRRHRRPAARRQRAATGSPAAPAATPSTTTC